MQTQKYKVIFFNLLIIFIFISCNAKINDVEHNDYKINIIEESVIASLYKVGNDNYFNFEIDDVKYTLIEYKVEGSNYDSIYNLIASRAKTWEEHNESRNKNDTLFNIRFQLWSELLYMDVSSNGIGYRSEYYVSEDKMSYEKY